MQALPAPNPYRGSGAEAKLGVVAEAAGDALETTAGPYAGAFNASGSGIDSRPVSAALGEGAGSRATPNLLAHELGSRQGPANPRCGSCPGRSLRCGQGRDVLERTLTFVDLEVQAAGPIRAPVRRLRLGALLLPNPLVGEEALGVEGDSSLQHEVDRTGKLRRDDGQTLALTVLGREPSP